MIAPKPQPKSTPKKTIAKPKKKPDAVTIGQILDHAAKLKYDERKLLIAQLGVLQQASVP